MKKFTLILCAVLIFGVSALQGQTNNGKIFLGLSSYALGMPVSSTGSFMSLGFGKTKYKSDSGNEDGNNTTFFNVQPKVGYFFTDNIVAGLEAMVVSSTENDPNSDGKYKESVLLAGVFARYYLPAGKFNPFLELEGGIGSYREKVTGTDYDYDDKYNISLIGGGVGLALPVGDKAAFDIVVGYNSATMKPSEDNTDNERMINGGIGVKIGFVLLLGGKL